ncbi:MAG TPA: Asp-tRNA(Asn)/Glu-tRNA(Gln) amidotransferase subunit GatB, partial [Verrucomicrobiales bacterium]|nr:Asp-tRNA(Asn)/Glu-tRNA(Gln) amidotransferase subunit GatB [Verrucomicrobiales bacterium]
MPVSDYIVTIGLEVHCQIKTNTKMFCGCKTSFADEPNTHTCPTCLGLPGALPVLNEFAIERTILAGMLLGCSTPPPLV